MFTISGTYSWSFVTQIFRNGQPSHGNDRKTFEPYNTSTQDPGVCFFSLTIAVLRSIYSHNHPGDSKVIGVANQLCKI